MVMILGLSQSKIINAIDAKSSVLDAGMSVRDALDMKARVGCLGAAAAHSAF
jgi:hypothetical protein